MAEQINFTANNNGNPVEITVDMNYPFYDISINGENVAQLEQDHHSKPVCNYRRLADGLVQEIAGG